MQANVSVSIMLGVWCKGSDFVTSVPLTGTAYAIAHVNPANQYTWESVVAYKEDVSANVSRGA